MPGHTIYLHDPQLYSSLFELWDDCGASDYYSDEYTVVDLGRDLRGHHEHTSDGYYFQVTGPNGVDGWAWGGALCFYSYEVDERLDGYEWLELPNDGFEWSYCLGDHVITMEECLVQSLLIFMQDCSMEFGYMPAGKYTIVDAGIIYDGLEERLDGWGYEYEMQPEEPYGIYLLQSEEGKRFWTFEQLLDRAIGSL